MTTAVDSAAAAVLASLRELIEEPVRIVLLTTRPRRQRRMTAPGWRMHRHDHPKTFNIYN